MTWRTHALLGISSLWLLTLVPPAYMTTNYGVLAACAAFGACVPDLDAAESKLKHIQCGGFKPFLLPAVALNRQFGHRGLLHSARGWATWSLLILPFAIWFGWLSVAALCLGYASHLAGDACTRTGIPLRYPRPERFHLLPATLRIATDSASEEVVFAIFACLSLALLLSRMSLHF